MASFWLYQSAFALQLAAMALFGAYVVVPRRSLTRVGLAALTAALLFQVAFFVGSWARKGQLPLADNFESLAFMALCMTLAFLAVEWRYHLGILGTFILPIPVLFLFMGYRFRQLEHPPSLALQNSFLAGHVAFSMLAYAFFTIASGVSVAFLVQERQLKNKQPGRVAFELPSLEELERISFLCVLAGFALLTLGSLAGMLWSIQIFGHPLIGDAKVLLGAALWLLYGLYLAWHLSGRFRGRPSAILLLVCFFVLFFGYYLANVYGGGHRFLH